MAELFGPSGFTGNTVEYDDPNNSILQNVIARRLGIPITLCALAIEVGRRVDIDIVGIGMPGHFLCRTAAQRDVSFFDPFHSPRPLTADQCKRLYENLTQIDNWSAEFLEPSSSRLMVIRVLSNLKSIYRRRSDVANLRWVMRLRSVIPEISAGESAEFAQLVRRSN
jgi:regulator of sirC expression with transglutaminase-like and TPR domain